MASAGWLLWAVIIAALFFDYVNGFHDTANAIATTVLTGALSIPMAIFMAAGLNFAGAFFSHAVAKTIAHDIVDKARFDVSLGTILAALLAAIAWNLITWRQGLPSSSSHALIGGIIGAVVGQALIQHHRLDVFLAKGITKTAIALVISPIFGFLVGHLFMVGLMWIFRHTAPSKLTRSFKFFQVLSAASMALSHGTNDTQKTMGVITMALLSAGYLKTADIPGWVVVVCAAAMAFGTAAGGWRIIKTVGRKVMTLQPVHGFAAETSGAAVIFAASFFGAPVSTTHVISSSIMGVGSAQSFSGVRWNVVRQIIGAWVLTFPVTAVLAALCTVLLHPLLG